MPKIPLINCNFRFNVFLVNDYKKFINSRQVLDKSPLRHKCSHKSVVFLTIWKVQDLQNVMDRVWIKFGSYCSSPKTMIITKDFITWVYTCPDIQLRAELQTLNTSNF